ncbi:hypothetical protein [Sphingomonas adhaesiva]|uniref:hypothetical protein n=1 Tax=Sphingomonas adhaesiva TaxID=28212 RepID=UPI002FFB4A3E
MLLRAAALLLLGIAWWMCGAGLTGERLVRFIVAVSVAAALVVLLLSVAATRLLAPLRRLLAPAIR